MDIILSAVDNMSGKVAQAMNKTRGHLVQLQKSSGFKAFKTLGNQALMAGGAITAAMGGAYLEAEKTASANARLEQVFKSMGETTGEAARQARVYSAALATQIGVDQNAISLTQAKLATFAQVSSESARMAGVFDRATVAAHDLAAAGFGEASMNAVQLGKALQDPIKGITAMNRSGVTFTEVEQKKIKALTQSGRVLEAQNMILSAVEKQVGGVAAATADDSAKMREAFRQMASTIGMALMPAVQEITQSVMAMVEPFRDFVQRNPGVIRAIAATGAALLAFGIAVKVITTVVTIMNAVLAMNPFVLIAIGIIAAIAAVTLLVKHWDSLGERFKALPGWAKIVVGIFALMNLPLLAIIATIKYLQKNWEQISAYFVARWEYIKSSFTGFIDFIRSIHSAFFNAGINIVMSIWNGMKGKFDAMTDWFGEKIQTIRDYLPFSPAKIGPLKDIHKLKIIETIQQSIKPGKLADTMERTAGAAKAAFMGGMSAPTTASASLTPQGGAGISINYSPTVNVTGGEGGITEQITAALNLQVDELRRMLRQIAADKARRGI